jgi:pimeloyl-ACP methyl ester carboxylesterase
MSGPSLDYLGAWTRARLARPTPRNLAAAASQAVASSYVAFFVTPGVSDAFFRVAGRPSWWRRFHRVVEGTSARSLHLADTLPDDMRNGLRIYRANVRRKLSGPEPRPVAVPVQLVVGLRDRFVRPVGFADYQRWAPNLTRVELPVGHWSPFSHPDLIARHTADFVDAVSGKQSSDERNTVRQ